MKLIDTDTPGYLGFAPDPQPELIATYPSGGKAVSVARGQGRDRYVDESGNQISVTSRMGSRPFNAAEIQSVLFGTDGTYFESSVGRAQGAGQRWRFRDSRRPRSRAGARVDIQKPICTMFSP